MKSDATYHISVQTPNIFRYRRFNISKTVRTRLSLGVDSLRLCVKIQSSVDNAKTKKTKKTQRHRDAWDVV